MAEHKNISAKILVVDDEPNVLRMVSYNLQTEGFEVVVAQSGNEALIKVMTETPDLVLLGRYKQVRLYLPKQPGKVLGFMGAKGGVGTTTVALNVATGIAAQEKKV